MLLPALATFVGIVFYALHRRGASHSDKNP
nr:hypothetical protein [Marinobacter antarcticus]